MDTSNQPLKTKQTGKSKSQQLSNWHIELVGDWTREEIDRIHGVLSELARNANTTALQRLFNGQETRLHHSSREGRAGRTQGKDIYLDKAWTDWTLAHELGHRWNNAWDKHPEAFFRQILGAGKWEWIKNTLRKFTKWLGSLLKKFGINHRFDWKSLWYHPGKAPPPCGIDRNFNSSEDLAESFASAIFPDAAKERATKAAKRVEKSRVLWDWGSVYADYWHTPRGRVIKDLFQSHLLEENGSKKTDQPTPQDQPKDIQIEKK